MERKIKRVKVGDIISEEQEEYADFKSQRKKKLIKQYRVIMVFQNHVMTELIACPEVRRSFSFNDLLVMGYERQKGEYEVLREERNAGHGRWGRNTIQGNN